MEEQKDKKSFYVQNVTPSHIYISDLKLYFKPFGVQNLSYFGSQELEGSQSLRKQLLGEKLIRLSSEEADQLMMADTEEMQNAVYDNLKKQNMEDSTDRVRLDGRDNDFEAETINLTGSRIEGKTSNKEISSAGNANDPQSYALAYKHAREQFAMNHKILSAQEFKNMVDNDKGGNLVRQYLTLNIKDENRKASSNNKQTSQMDQTPYRSSTKQQPPEGFVNFPSGYSPDGADELPLGEEIDLASELSDVSSSVGKPSFKR